MSMGPIVEAAVGHSSPSFSVYGEPVVLAVRLEQTGLPQRLHATGAVARVLMGHPGLAVENRGLVELQNGNGIQETFWLTRSSEDNAKGYYVHPNPGTYRGVIHHISIPKIRK